MTGDGSVQTKVYIFIVQPTGSAAASLETVQYSAVWASFGQAQFQMPLMMQL